MRGYVIECEFTSMFGFPNRIRSDSYGMNLAEAMSDYWSAIQDKTCQWSKLSLELNGETKILEEYKKGDKEMRKSIENYNYEQYVKGNVLFVPNDIVMIADSALRQDVSVKKVVFEKDSTIKYLGNRCFETSMIEEINLPESLVAIGNRAFNHCRHLKKFSCGDNVTEIGDYAFYETSIKTFRIPNLLNYIGDGAFGRTKIERINVNTLEHWMRICFADNMSNPSCGDSARLYANGRMVKSVRIPNTVDVISSNVFRGLNGVERVHIHKDVNQIGYRAFYKCKDLKSFEIDKRSRCCGISSQSLGLCKNLASVKMPYYAERAFEYDECDDDEEEEACVAQF